MTSLPVPATLKFRPPAWVPCLLAACFFGACGGADPTQSTDPPSSDGTAAESGSEATSSYDPARARALLIQSLPQEPAEAETALETATGLAPSFVDGWLLLAAARVRQGDVDGAFESLDRLPTLGIRAPIDQYEPLEPLRDDPRWAELVASLDQNAEPRGSSDRLFQLAEKDLLTEGIAYDPATDSWFVSAVHGRKIVRVGSDGSVTDWLTEDDGLWGVFGLAVDEERRRLWATTAAMPQMRGFEADAGRKTALLEIDLDRGEILGRTELSASSEPGPQLNDLAVAADGSVYASDLTPPGGLYRLVPGAKELEPVGEEMLLNSPQGLALLRDDSVLVAADYSLGLTGLDLASGESWFVEPPGDLWLQALDGLATTADGELVAIQNGGYPPHRILRLRLSDDLRRVNSWRVVAQALPEWREPTLGTVVRDGTTQRFVYVSASQWPLFPESAEPDRDALEEPTIHSVELEP